MTVARARPDRTATLSLLVNTDHLTPAYGSSQLPTRQPHTGPWLGNYLESQQGPLRLASLHSTGRSLLSAQNAHRSATASGPCSTHPIGDYTINLIELVGLVDLAGSSMLGQSVSWPGLNEDCLLVATRIRRSVRPDASRFNKTERPAMPHHETIATGGISEAERPDRLTI